MLSGRKPNCDREVQTAYDENIRQVQTWFAEHVTLFDQPYTLDYEQAQAVYDAHYSTLVVARAGSGKTRVIVAKVAYLLAQCDVELDQITIFMFNRTAALEVNQRIAGVKIDGRNLVDTLPSIASTFHKFAFDLVKQQTGKTPQIIVGPEHEKLIRAALDEALSALNRHPSPKEYEELLSIVSGFITRAGQKFPGAESLPELEHLVLEYISTHQNSSADKQRVFWHQVSFLAYKFYLARQSSNQPDFNLLMAKATKFLSDKSKHHLLPPHLQGLKYIMIDEYQDFSYLFFALTNALRQLAPPVKLFAVGDDWQAINRFAGSDVDYFIRFQHYFSKNSIIIPLATNYRSCCGIVERANHFMLTHYDPKAIPARAFNPKHGEIKFLNPSRTKYRQDDIKEDGLGDGRFHQALAQFTSRPQSEAARLLKLLTRLVRQNRHSEIMLLHRHNFTTLGSLGLAELLSALRAVVVQECILTPSEFEQRIRCMTMHKSKGLEAEVVILLEMNREVVASSHPHATIFPLFGDTREAEIADQQRLLYVAMTRAKRKLYVISHEKVPII